MATHPAGQRCPKPWDAVCWAMGIVPAQSGGRRKGAEILLLWGGSDGPGPGQVTWGGGDDAWRDAVTEGRGKVMGGQGYVAGVRVLGGGRWQRAGVSAAGWDRGHRVEAWDEGGGHGTGVGDREQK